MGIPFERLGIPAPFRKSVSPGAPRSAKVAVAKGLIPCTADVQLSLLYVLAVDKDRAVAKAARATMRAMPVPQILSGISQSTFPKVLEFIAQFKPKSSWLCRRRPCPIGLHGAARDGLPRCVAAPIVRPGWGCVSASPRPPAGAAAARRS